MTKAYSKKAIEAIKAKSLYFPKGDKLVRAKRSQYILRIPTPLYIEIQELTFKLKVQNPKWSINKVVQEALIYFLEAVKAKQLEKRDKK